MFDRGSSIPIELVQVELCRQILGRRRIMLTLGLNGRGSVKQIQPQFELHR